MIAIVGLSRALVRRPSNALATGSSLVPDARNAYRREAGNLGPPWLNSRIVGHLELSIADIEFVGNDPYGATDEVFLDDADVVLIEDRRQHARTRAAAQPRRRTVPLPARYTRIFDDAQTQVWSRF